MVAVCGVEVRYVLGSVFGDMVEDIFCQLAVRINEADTSSAPDVLENHIGEKGTFSRTSLTYQIRVVSAVF